MSKFMKTFLTLFVLLLVGFSIPSFANEYQHKFSEFMCTFAENEYVDTIKIYDFEYQKFVYNLIVEEIMKIPNTIHITFHNRDDTNIIPNNLSKIWESNTGQINHMNDKGNQETAQTIKKFSKCR